MKPRAFHPEADTEFLEALARYAEKSQNLGRRFYHAIHALSADACRAPTVHRRMPGTGDVRRHFKILFPYAVPYVDEPDRVLVLAVAHFKRRPGLLASSPEIIGTPHVLIFDRWPRSPWRARHCSIGGPSNPVTFEFKTK